MKLAITSWNGHISPVFDVCQKMLILDIQEKVVASRTEELFAHSDPLKKISQLSSLSVETVVCGAISNHLVDMLSSLNIQVIPFISGEIEEVVSAFLSGRLSENIFLMPGCRKRCKRRRGRCVRR